MHALTIYTVNFGDYDVLHDPHCIDHEYICFSDVPRSPVGGGPWWPAVGPIRQKTPRLEARWHKTHSHELFPHTEWTLYVDASLEVLRCPLDFLEWSRTVTGASDRDLYLFRHPERDCLYDEAECCVQMGKDTRERIEPHTARYRRMTFPHHTGLWQSGVLLRRNTPAVKRFNEMWWWEIITGSHRDQVSLPVVLTFSGVAFASLPHERWTEWFLCRADHGRKEG